jgi:hypothetical protein
VCVCVCVCVCIPMYLYECMYAYRYMNKCVYFSGEYIRNNKLEIKFHSGYLPSCQRFEPSTSLIKVECVTSISARSMVCLYEYLHVCMYACVYTVYHLLADFLEHVGSSKSHKTLGLHGLLRDNFTFTFYLCMYVH